MMRPSQLADLLLSPLTSDYMPFMMGRMQAAMGYHRSCKITVVSVRTCMGSQNNLILGPSLFTNRVPKVF